MVSAPPPPKKKKEEKKPFHVAAFSVFLIVSIFFNGIQPNFSFLQKEGMPRMCWSCLFILM